MGNPGPQGPRGNSDSSDVVAVIAALLGAVIGALATLAGERFLSARADLRRFDALKRGLELERTRIRELAHERVDTADGALDLARQPPLPTEAWRTLLASGLVPRLAEADLRALAEFYGEVERANYLAAQIPTYLLIANIGREEVASGFLTQAKYVGSEAFKPVLDADSKLGGHISP